MSKKELLEREFKCRTSYQVYLKLYQDNILTAKELALMKQKLIDKYQADISNLNLDFTPF